MTGAGVVLLEEDAAKVEQRSRDLMAELDPKSTIGLAMVGQLAMLSVRMERAGRQEEQALASRVRHAVEVFDQERVDQAELLFDTIADNPRKNLRLLRRSPEGVDRLIEAWEELRDDLTRPDRLLWTASHQALVASLLGLRPERAQGSRVDLLGLAVQGEAVSLREPEWVALEPEARQGWAKDRLLERIDAEIAGLEAHYETLNLEVIELDRLGAADVALFDPSRAATLARRYESEASRRFFKALKEFRLAEAEAAARPTPKPVRQPAPEPEPVKPPESAKVAEPLASSCARVPSTLREPKPAPIEMNNWSPVPYDGAARGIDGRVIAIGKAVVGPR